MLKKLSRNENFITCIQCEKGGFLQIGPPKKQQVQCPICNEKQTIEKGALMVILILCMYSFFKYNY